MNNKYIATEIPYSDTGKFSKIVTDFVSGDKQLRPFYQWSADLPGIKQAIAARQKFPTNRTLLVEALQEQYKDVDGCELISDNIHSLLSENTFTICTAHQPNLFTGHLYFIYKILHIIKMCESLKDDLPQYNFIPVFFMGSEDADLEELNHITVDGKLYTWETAQKGAVGRMTIDQNLIKLIDELSGQLLVEPFGEEVMQIVRSCYQKGRTVQDATFDFVHTLFKEYGLLVLLPDSQILKKGFKKIISQDLFDHNSKTIVDKTSNLLSENYKVQAYPREINLFYLKDEIRNRIVQVGDQFVIHDTDINFSEDEMKEELENHPERFSPNVILRGVFQEFILPDVAWIGGGGELAYWLQLKDLFDYYEVPFPVLLLRNSFLIIEAKYSELMQKLSLQPEELFEGKEILFDRLVKTNSEANLSLEQYVNKFRQLYRNIQGQSAAVDGTLLKHVAALEARHLKSIKSLEKKLLRAERKKFAAGKNQLNKVFEALFPDGGLQERTENILLFYARYGKGFIQELKKHSGVFQQEFCILKMP